MRRSSTGRLPVVFLGICLGVGIGGGTKTEAGWFSGQHRQRPSHDDCAPGTSRHQAKAESAYELAKSRQMADRSCAELTCMAEQDRYRANIQALAAYQRFPLQRPVVVPRNSPR